MITTTPLGTPTLSRCTSSVYMHLAPHTHPDIHMYLTYGTKVDLYLGLVLHRETLTTITLVSLPYQSVLYKEEIMLVLGLIDIPWWVLLILVLCLYTLYTMRDFHYFKNQGMPYVQPLPIIGTIMNVIKKGPVNYDLDLLKQYGDKVVGEFCGSTPGCVSFNTDFLSQMMIKEFPYFTNRNVIPTGNYMNDQNLLGLQDDHWKHVRSVMSPSFTSGKLKKMNAEINRCARGLIKNLENAAKNEGTIVVKDYTGAYTMDVIASTAFGIRVNSQEEPNNAFVQHAKEAFDIQFTNPVLLIALLYPGLMKIAISLGYVVHFFGKIHEEFFAGITKQTMAMRREEEENTRSDFIQLMIQAQRGEDISEKSEDGHDEEHKMGSHDISGNQGLTTDEIIANAMLFFVAGYDTTATSLQFFLYNMARFPEIQQKLVEEIMHAMGNEESIEYSKLSEMPYLEQCINENLRMYPPVIRVDRKCSKDVTINNIHLRKDMVVGIPVYAIHHDPNRWPEPEKFDPERFSDENKKNQNPFDFIPFGQGPRNCIGIRLALLEMKVAIIYMLRAFKFSTCDKTVHSLTFQLKGLLSPNEDVVVKIEPRNEG